MTPTLEQELEAVALSTDYRVTISLGTGDLHVRVHYLPSVHRGQSGVVLDDGCIAHESFGGPQRRRWRKATEMVLEAIEGHRAMLVATGVRQI